jgi:putative heme-binding domain-containing protein
MTALVGALGDGNADVAAVAATTLRKLSLRKESAAQVSPALLKCAAREDLSPAARLEALGAIPGSATSFDQPLFSFLLSQLRPDQPAALRLAAAEVLGRAQLTPAQLAELAPQLKTAGPMEIDKLLAAFGRSHDDALGQKLLDVLGESKALSSLRADSLRPRLKNFGPDVQKRAETLYARHSPDAAAQKERLEKLLATLPTGDVRRGQAVFNGTKVACVSCHAIGYVGGHVGPDLTRIGAIRTRRDLLESILFPSASFVQSFEPVIVETTDGDVQSGILKKNDAEEVVLVAGPDKEVRLPRKEVREMRPGSLSVMPAGLDQQLSPQEMADLVTFLQACK